MEFKVILADDEPYILEGLKKRVDWKELGFQIVATASNGPDCLDKIKVFNPDLIITDIRMPGFTGLDLLSKIQDLDCKIEVIIISGYSEFDYAKQAITMGVTSYLLKPIDNEELKSTLIKIKTLLYKKKSKLRTCE